MTHKKPEASNIVIFGGNGDLAWRKLIPAFFNLYINDFMPSKFAIYGIHHQALDEDEYRKHLLEGINTFSRSGKATKEEWKKFSQHVFFFQGDFTQEDTYTRLGKTLEANDKKWKERASRLFYYSVAPRFIEPISIALSSHGLASVEGKDRIVVEKPFGNDLASAKELNKLLTKHFKESQIYRIDHYLGKETVQNMMAFRFANYVFEPLWNNRFIDHIQISVAEQVSVSGRGGYYDQSGALRDMIQNHLMQIMCVVAMECPGKYEAEAIRDARVKVVQEIRSFKKKDVFKNVVRGQYTAGKINGVSQKGYRQEEKVAKDSNTETFVAARLYIDNERWQGVPFFLRTGKCLPKQSSVIVIQFRESPHKLFQKETVPNRLIISIQPEQEISLLFESKIPGVEMKLKPVEMDFTYKEYYTEAVPEAYEALLLDVLEGDATLFMRADQVEAAWAKVMPILDAWKSTSDDLLSYKAGTWGPEKANELIQQQGFDWTFLPQPLQPAKPPRKPRKAKAAVAG